MKKIKLKDNASFVALSLDELKNVWGGSGPAEITCHCNFYNIYRAWLGDVEFLNGEQGTADENGCDYACNQHCLNMYHCTSCESHFTYEHTDYLS